MADQNKTKKIRFFNFSEETYDASTGKFKIDNLKEESERLENYINEKTSIIEDEKDLDKKTLLTQSYIKESKSLKKEISDKKSEITKKHIKDLTDELANMAKLIESIQENIKEHTSVALIDAGMADVFYVAPSYEIRTGPITDKEKLQMAIAILNELGIETKIYQDGKLLKPSTKEETNEGEEDSKKTKFKDDDASYNGKC